VKTKKRILLIDPPGSALAAMVNEGVCFNASTDTEYRRRRGQVDTLIEGVGLNRRTENLHADLIDEAVTVSDLEAVDMAHHLLYREGLFLGSSSSMHCAGVVIAYCTEWYNFRHRTYNVRHKMRKSSVFPRFSGFFNNCRFWFQKIKDSSAKSQFPKPQKKID
jgi:hypothetical protein